MGNRPPYFKDAAKIIILQNTYQNGFRIGLNYTSVPG
jgi:hypothetical protein